MKRMFLLMVVLVLCQGCGQKRALYLPEESVVEENAPKASPEKELEASTSAQ